MGLDVTGIGEVAGAVTNIVNKIWPDASEEQKNQLAAQLAQLEVNKQEAASTNWFVAGWRPYVGWIAGTALGLVYIPKALLMSFMWAYQCYTIVHAWSGQGPFPILPLYPDLGVTDLIGLLASLLGMSGIRMAEKFRGVAR